MVVGFHGSSSLSWRSLSYDCTEARTSSVAAESVRPNRAEIWTTRIGCGPKTLRCACAFGKSLEVDEAFAEQSREEPSDPLSGQLADNRGPEWRGQHLDQRFICAGGRTLLHVRHPRLG